MNNGKKYFNITFGGICGLIGGLVGFSITYWLLSFILEPIESYLENKLKGD